MACAFRVPEWRARMGRVDGRSAAPARAGGAALLGSGAHARRASCWWRWRSVRRRAARCRSRRNAPSLHPQRRCHPRQNRPRRSAAASARCSNASPPATATSFHRPRARHQPAHREAPRRQHPRQARAAIARPGRRPAARQPPDKLTMNIPAARSCWPSAHLALAPLAACSKKEDEVAAKPAARKPSGIEAYAIAQRGHLASPSAR